MMIFDMETYIAFKVDNKGIKSDVVFKILHSMDSNDFDVAVHSWLHRTNNFTPEDLQEYFLSKGHKCKVSNFQLT